MSRYVQWRGQLWEREIFRALYDTAPDACPHCEGMGVVPEQIDEERHDVAVPCPWCRMYCKTCNNWVKKTGHQCTNKETHK